MADLQAAVDFTVELGSFYNIDLFQRGYYQIRVGLKSFSNRTPYKVDVSLKKHKDCDLIHPASLINGIAVSKTFQIMYKSEDVLLNDLIYFKVQMLVDSNRLEECVEKSGLQLIVELWFSEEDSGTEAHDKFECVCTRAHNLNFRPSKGLHTHVSILFDYFYLSAIGITVHGSLVALHQPIYNPRQPNMSWPLRGNTLSTLESVLFNARVPSAAALNYKHIATSSLQSANYMFRHISQVLLSAYESLQSTTDKLVRVASSSKTPVPQAHKDCSALLADMCKEVERCDSEEEFLQHATSKVAHLCAYNVVLWDKFVELFASNIRAAKHLAREYHVQRIKRYAEGFFTSDYPKSALTDCYEPSTHGHVELANRIRSSVYFQSLPALPLECPELDGDCSTLPIIFEDVFSDSVERAISGTDLSIKSDETSTSSADIASAGSEAADAAAATVGPPPLRAQRNRKVIRSVRPHTLRRPSSYALDNAAAAAAQGKRWESGGSEHYAGKEQPQLIGFKRLSSDFATAALPATVVGLHYPSSGAQYGAVNPYLGEPLSPHRRSLLMPSRSAPASGASGAAVTSAAAATTLFADAGSRSSPLQRRGSSRRLQRTQQQRSNGGSLPDLSPNKLVEECSSDEDALAQPGGGIMKRVGSTGSAVMATGCAVIADGGSDRAATAAGSMGSLAKRSGLTAAQGPRRELLAFDFSVAGSSGDSRTDGVTVAGVAAIGVNSPMAAAASLDGLLPMLPDGVVANGGTVSSDDDTPDGGGRNAAAEAPAAVSCSSVSLIVSETDSSRQRGSGLTTGGTSSGHPPPAAVAVATSSQLQPPILHASASNYELPVAAAAATASTVMAKAGVSAGMTQSRSAPGFVQLEGRQQQQPIAEALVQPVADAMLSFLTAKEELKMQMNYSGHLYSDFASLPSSTPYFWLPGKREREDMHLIIGVHGLDGNNQDLRLVRTYLEVAMPGDRVDFLMSESNKDTFVDFETMTEKLVNEILRHLDMYSTLPARISFVGHSLGNIIIRSALGHPKLEHLLPNLHTYLSLSGPHLGTLYGQSGLVNMGMWVIQKLKKSSSLLQLSLRDKLDLKETFLYKLSQQPALEFFKNILLVSSPQDKYAPYHSTRIELCRAAVRDTSDYGTVYVEMVHNLLEPLVLRPQLTVVRYDVHHALPGGANSVIGRAAHIAVLDSELFLEKFITVSALKYFK